MPFAQASKDRPRGPSRKLGAQQTARAVWPGGPGARRVLGDDHGPASGDGSGGIGVPGAIGRLGETAPGRGGFAADGPAHCEGCRPLGAADGQIGVLEQAGQLIAEGTLHNSR